MGNGGFAIIGGDARSGYARDILAREGYLVQSFGLGRGDDCRSVGEAVAGCSYVVAPVPFSRDGVFLNAPLCACKIHVEEFLKALSPEQKLFAGGISRKVAEIISGYGIAAFDLLADSRFAALNAVATAEGAVKIAIESSPTTINGRRALVTGFGNIGKVLAKLLGAFGADVSVTSRRAETDREIAANGYKILRIGDLSENLKNFDYIFNTVPAVLIDAGSAAAISEDALYIELASKPYGIDKDAAYDLGLKVIDAPNLPGKTAPKTAAEYIVGMVLDIIKEGRYEREN